ncbi:steroid receptor-associated and regulated protein [Alexandromys fortis]|uniref:steroid receptor-associated and regulated protein n=1 Tax=Alexandromys fortis TaxID=100897 RepID=UPI0021525214|nr:steroid receptor-associated and regulated protein [Microtus fortis]
MLEPGGTDLAGFPALTSVAGTALHYVRDRRHAHAPSQPKVLLSDCGSRASSTEPQDRGASLKESSLEMSCAMQPAGPQKAVPTAHLTVVIDCATGKQISLAAPPVPPQASRPSQGCVTPPMKTFVMFCGENTLRGTQDFPLSCRPLAGTKDTVPSDRGLPAPASLPASPPSPQDDPQAQRSFLKPGATERRAVWDTVKCSLQALSACVCGQAE